MILEERDYHVFTGKLNELVKLYETEGIELQQSYLGNLVGVFTTDIGALNFWNAAAASSGDRTTSAGGTGTPASVRI